jgi:very-short-patch-repair endonuclease
MSALTPLAKTLRRKATPHEHKLWQHLRSNRINGIKFRRQQTIGPYIVDFVCHQAKLIVELDGSQHALQAVQDADRTRWLESQGFQVLRFWNNDIDQNLEGVLTVILQHLSPSPLPLSHQGRGVQSVPCLSHQGRGVQSVACLSHQGRGVQSPAASPITGEGTRKSTP